MIGPPCCVSRVTTSSASSTSLPITPLRHRATIPHCAKGRRISTCRRGPWRFSPSRQVGPSFAHRTSSVCAASRSLVNGASLVAFTRLPMRPSSAAYTNDSPMYGVRTTSPTSCGSASPSCLEVCVVCVAIELTGPIMRCLCFVTCYEQFHLISLFFRSISLQPYLKHLQQVA